MTCTTFVSENDFLRVPESKIIREFLSDAQKALGKRIIVEKRAFYHRRWFRKEKVMLYSVLLDVGHGEAQIVNFAPRACSDWSINHHVPEQEVAAYLMGLASFAWTAPPPSGRL